MRARYLSVLMILVVLLAGMISTAVPPARAASFLTVSLDSSSTSQTDVVISPSSTAVKSFRIGAIINASSTGPLNSVYGWQFTINYNSTAFVPQGDPSAASLYPDGAVNTVLFGAQTTAGTVNWAGLLNANNAFGSSSVSSIGGNGQITVFLTLISPAPAVSLSAKTLLANVNFELLSSKNLSQSFTISNVLFVDNTGGQLSGVGPGASASVTVTNSPPSVHLTASPAPGVGPFAFSFNATATDSDDSVLNPGGYFWDFGDGTQDLGVTGPNIVHDFGVAGRFNVTIRVQDSLGATGSARDSLGNPIFNNQPSHSFMSVVAGGAANVPPVAIFTFSPANPLVGQNILFDGSASNDPDGTVVLWSWNFGDGSVMSGGSPTANHSYSSGGNFTVKLVVTDNGGATGNTTALVHLVALQPTVVIVNTNGPFNNTVVTGPFSTSIVVLNVTNLHAWQFTLSFDPNLVSTSSGNVTLGPFWQFAINSQNGFDTIVVNQTSVTIALSLIQSYFGFDGTGVLATIHFTPIATGTLPLHLSNTILLNSSLAQIPVITKDGVVIIQSIAPVDLPPVARFIFSPAKPLVGQTVFFDGSSSFDPDGFITQWQWSFGDGLTIFNGPQTFHSYNNPGNYTVTLTVTDNAFLTSSISMTIMVHQKLMHDVAVVFVEVYPTVVVSSGFVSIVVGIANNGLSNETVSVTAFYDSHPIQTISGISIPAVNCFNCFSVEYIPILWDTTGVPAGNYTISATILLPTDQNPSDNSLSDGKVTVLPPPVITLTPSSGSLGTKVLVQGSGFNLPFNPYGPSIDVLQVSFDDMFLGFAITHTGSFNFTFDVPHAEPGVHQVKVLDENTLAHASANFIVIAAAQTGGLAVSVTVGTVYFPQDKVAIYVLATLNGAPVNPSATQVTAVVINPNGTTINLALVAQTNGLYKATLSLTKSATIGTYAILAKAHMAGPIDATSVTTFEVRLPWVSSGSGQATITTAAIVGVAGILAVFWKKGYIRRRDDASPLPF